MGNIRIIIRGLWLGTLIFVIVFSIVVSLLLVLQNYVNSPASGFWSGLLKGLAAILLGLSGIVLFPLFYLLEFLYPYWQIIAFLFVILLGADFTIRYFEKKAKVKEIKRKSAIIEAQKKIEEEIKRRENIVFDLLNNLYRETEKEVNKTLMPTLSNELYVIYTGLQSDNMNDLINNGSSTDFQNIIDSIISELNRLKELSLNAQAKGYTDDEEESTYQDEIDGVMTKEKALHILELKADATNKEIKDAYRSLVKKYNTDQRPNLEEHIKIMLEEKMKELNSAKDCLSALGLI